MTGHTDGSDSGETPDTGSAEQDGYQTEWPTEAAGPRRKEGSAFGFMRELPVLIVIAFGLALLMKTFLIQAFYIPSESMEPTLWGHQDLQTRKEYSDRVLVNKLVYRFREPRRGEVIVFIATKADPNRPFLQKVKSFLFEGLGVTRPADVDFIKRVVGLPGETIQVTQNGVFIKPVRGKRFKLSEPYIKRTGQHPTTDNAPCGTAKDCAQGPPQPPFKVPVDEYFVMGDNRENSSDSRSALSTIKREDIVGKAFVKIWPPRRMDLIDTPVYCSDPRVRCPREKADGLPAAVPLVAFALAAGVSVRRRTR